MKMKKRTAAVREAKREFEGVKMPLYEYKCMDCEKVFIVALYLSEKQRGATVLCPGCNSKNVRQQISSFTPKTASKTA